MKEELTIQYTRKQWRAGLVFSFKLLLLCVLQINSPPVIVPISVAVAADSLNSARVEVPLDVNRRPCVAVVENANTTLRRAEGHASAYDLNLNSVMVVMSHETSVDL